MKKKSLNDIVKDLQDVDNEYRPVPFWFINHYLRDDLLRRQIGEMSEKGFGGVMFHGRDGLRSDYLGKEWEDALRKVINESEKHRFGVWLYDEEHYPSGPAGNAIFRRFPERTMSSLAVFHEQIVQPGAKVELDIPENISMEYVLAFLTSGKTIRLKCPAGSRKFKWSNRSDEQMTILFLQIIREWPIPGQYFPFYPDYLDKEVSRQFIDMTYGWYAKKFRDKNGSTIKGIFTDNSCFNFGRIRRSVAWTPKLPERFLSETGIELEKVLPGVFCRKTEYELDRLIFWRFLGNEYLKTFVHPIKKICIRNRIAATGHYCLEDGLSEHIRQIGDRFDLKRGQTLPCVDMLGREMGEDLFESERGTTCANTRGTADAAYYSSGSRVMCECLGLLGGWKLDLGEIKRVTGSLAAQGIDIFVPHGLYYSIAGTRKWECIPDHYHNPMWKYYREWTDWISKISFLMAYSDRIGKVALLHPSSTLRANIELGIMNNSNNIPCSDRGEICDLADFTFRTTVNLLVKNNIEFDIIDEKIIQCAKVRRNHLILKSGKGKEREISLIILPCCKIIEQETAVRLMRFHDSGGIIISLNSHVEKIYNPSSNGFLDPLEMRFTDDFHYDFNSNSTGRIPEIVNTIRNCVPQQILLSSGSEGIVSRIWEKWDKRFHMLHNSTNRTVENVHVRFQGSHEPLLLDLYSNRLVKFVETEGDGHEFTHSFASGETVLLVSGEAAKPRKNNMVSVKRNAGIRVGEKWEFRTMNDNILPLREGKVENRDFSQIHTFHFDISELSGKIKVVIDREMTKSELLCERYSARLKCMVNGNDVSIIKPGTVIDFFMYEADISGFVREGINELTLEYSSEYLDTDRKFHVPFITGSFELVKGRKGFSIARPRKMLHVGDWCTQGYPFYAGEASYRRTITIPERLIGKKLLLSLGDIANSTEVMVNGKSLGRRILPPWEYDISSFSKDRKIELDIHIVNTPQNLFCEKRIASGLLGPVRIHELE